MLFLGSMEVPIYDQQLLLAKITEIKFLLHFRFAINFLGVSFWFQMGELLRNKIHSFFGT